MTLITHCDIGEGKVALVVDDEPTVGHIMSQVLEQMGYKVDQALDGDEAIERARDLLYDIVICDILMPRTNGMVLYALWREQAPLLAQRTIFVTGDSLGAETEEFIARSGRPCIYKPFKLNELAQTIVDMQAALNAGKPAEN
jgi:CheY-like chemotaxis protein